MITRKALGAIALATTCLAPLAAFAQTSAPATGGTVIAGTPFSGEIGVGVMGVMGLNPDQAGRYNGLNTSGIDILGNFDISGRSPWDSGGVRYYDLVGNNLVFQTGDRLGNGGGLGTPNYNNFNTFGNNLVNAGSLGFRAGDQGTWEGGVNYNSITYTGNVIGSLYNVNGGQASLNPGLYPYGGATSQTIATPGAIPKTTFTGPYLAGTGAVLPVQTGTRRDIISGDFKYILGNWTFTGAFTHEHKEGSMEQSFDGPWGGAAFAQPVDYDTDRYDASAAYTTPLYQAVIQNSFSHFSDNNSFVALPYPFANTAKPFQNQAAYSTPPSNSADYVTIMLATNAIPDTRINLNARVGFEKQDDTFSPNTADPGAAGLRGTTGFLNLNPSVQGMSETSPDITATVYQVKVSASSHLIPRTDVNAYYGVDGRSVDIGCLNAGYAQPYGGVTCKGVYGSGSGSETAPSSATPYAFVVPQDWLKQDLGANATYRLIPEYNTRLTAGYRLDITDRSNAQVGHSSTNTGSVAVASDIGPQVDGKLSFDYASRSGNLSYVAPWLNLDGPTSGPTYSGAYYQAPMTSEAVTARADYTPMESLSGSFFLQFKNENYNYPAALKYTGPDGSVTTAPLTGEGQGVKQDNALVLGPDINWRPSKAVNVHFFYTYERLFFNNTGNGACANSNTGTCAGSVGNFQNEDTTGTHTVGVNGEWRVNEKLKLRGDYTFSYGSVMFTEFNGVFVPGASANQSYQNVSNYPDYNTEMHNVRLTATYELAPNLELVGQVAYSYFHNNDWRDNPSAIQGGNTTAAPGINILTPGYESPNYSVVMLMTGVKFKF